MTRDKNKPLKLVSYVGGYVQPTQESNLKLGPGIYSLGSRSTLPYVELLGSGGYQKTISWGEVAEVPCGEMVTVRNASYHGGDMYINAGAEPDPMPARITVPVQLNIAGWEFFTSFSQVVDTRRAKKCYFAMNNSGAGGITIVGVRVGSLNTDNLLTAPGERGIGFSQVHATAGDWGLIPMGYRSIMGDDTRPHVLLDYGYVIINPAPVPPAACYFVLEY